MESVGKYQIVHPDGTKLSPVDMATLAEMVYAGIVRAETPLFAVSSQRTTTAGDIPYLAFLISRLKESPSAPPPRLPVVTASAPPPLIPVSTPVASPQIEVPLIELTPASAVTIPVPAVTVPPPLPEPAIASVAVEAIADPLSVPAPIPAPTHVIETVPELPTRTSLSLPGSLSGLSPQVRTYVTFGMVAFILVGGIGVWQWVAQAATLRARQLLLGSWQQADGTRLVFKDDGTGAITKPDPTYGNRTHLFRWERQGEKIALTEKRILLPGGTRQTAADSIEAIVLSEDGQQLRFGEMELVKESVE
jgi:hypothetical protein